jgi:plastocyanin
MATRKIACVLLAAALLAAACSKRAKPEAVAPSASAAKPAEPPSQRAPVDVPAGRPAPAGGSAATLGAAEPDAGADDPALDETSTGAAIVHQTISPQDPSESEADQPLEPGPDSYRGPGDVTPGRRGGSGTLRGTVSFKGTPPPAKPLVIDTAAAARCVHEGSVDSTDRRLLIDGAGGVANVVLTLKIPGRTAQPAPRPFVLDQRGCRFEPHVIIVAAGSQVSFANSDSISHNVHTYPQRNQGMNRLIPAGASVEQQVDKADQIEIKCDIHPWMNSWVIVTEAPASALSAADGSFEIKGLPPGRWELSLWHEQLGKSSQAVSVVAGSVTEVEIEIGGRAPSRRRR